MPMGLMKLLTILVRFATQGPRRGARGRWWHLSPQQPRTPNRLCVRNPSSSMAAAWTCCCRTASPLAAACSARLARTSWRKRSSLSTGVALGGASAGGVAARGGEASRAWPAGVPRSVRVLSERWDGGDAMEWYSRRDARPARCGVAKPRRAGGDGGGMSPYGLPDWVLVPMPSSSRTSGSSS